MSATSSWQGLGQWQAREWWQGQDWGWWQSPAQDSSGWWQTQSSAPRFSPPAEVVYSFWPMNKQDYPKTGPASFTACEASSPSLHDKEVLMRGKSSTNLAAAAADNDNSGASLKARTPRDYRRQQSPREWLETATRALLAKRRRDPYADSSDTDHDPYAESAETAISTIPTAIPKKRPDRKRLVDIKLKKEMDHHPKEATELDDVTEEEPLVEAKEMVGSQS